MTAVRLRCLQALAPLVALAACSEPADTPPPAPRNPASPISAAPPPLPPAAQGINDVGFSQPAPPSSQSVPALDAAAARGFDPVLVRAQVMLDRARFSPGVIDGKDGDNVRQAIAGFEQARGLPSDGKLDEAVWQALTEADAGPVVQSYVITAQDVAGPFIGAKPEDYEALSKLPTVGYERPSEALAEKFHMDEDLLLALNPGSAFAAGQAIVVVAPGPDKLDVQVASIEVDKEARALKAYDGQGKLVAFYPASVGSKEYPAPSGEWAVRAVARNPVYYYNPERLTFGRDKADGKLEIKAGPNNPVGTTWIDLTRDTYGIHGAADPEQIGKTQSHGCVRLTNWDAAELASAVKSGTKVAFVSGA